MDATVFRPTSPRQRRVNTEARNTDRVFRIALAVGLDHIQEDTWHIAVAASGLVFGEMLLDTRLTNDE
jgi:hypothetical protein